MQSHTLISGDPTEEEAAAILAAVGYLLAEQSASGVTTQAAAAASWSNAAKLIAQGLIPTRMPAAPRWGTIERLRRAGKGGNGVTGT